MSISDYETSRQTRGLETQSTIDVLLGQYRNNSSTDRQRGTNLTSVINETTAKDDPELAYKMARGVRDLPERLRVNSGNLGFLLGSIFN